MTQDHARGVVLAILAYASWGYLSPGGARLLEAWDPFTINTLRTAIALPLLFLLFSPTARRDALRYVRSDLQVWILGGFWLVLTFTPYLWSLKFLPPSITTLTLYMSPLAVAAWQFIKHREPVTLFIVPTVVATVFGGWIASQGAGGVPSTRDGALGLGLAIVGVVGWIGYTLHVKALTRTRDPNAVTLAVFVTSGVVFALGALIVEDPWHTVARSDVAILVVYAIIPGGVSFWLYSQSLKYASAATVSVLLGVELIATVIVSYFVSDEIFTDQKIAGMGLVLVFVTLYLWMERRRMMTPSPVDD